MKGTILTPAQPAGAEPDGTRGPSPDQAPAVAGAPDQPSAAAGALDQPPESVAPDLPAGAGAPVSAPVPAPAAGGGLSARSLRRGGLLYSGANFLGMGLGFVASMVMVRAATQAEVGSYVLLIQSTTAVGLVLQLGLVQGALRFAPIARGAGGEAATRTLRRRLLVLQLAIWAVLAPPTALLWPLLARKLHAPQLAGAYGWVLATAMLAGLSRLLDSYLRAFRFYTSSALLSNVVPRALILAGFVALLLVSPGATPWTALAGVFVGAQLATALAYAACLPATTAGESSEPRAAQPPPSVWSLFTTTTPMGLRTAAALLMTSSDVWVLSWASGQEQVAVYGVVGRIVAVLGTLTLAANFLLPQEFAVLYADGKRAELERLARTAATAVAMLGLVSLAGILLLGRPLIRFAFGESYAAGWVVLLILAVGSFWDGASGSAGYVLQMTGRQVHLLWLTAAAAAVNLLLSLLLAPRFGAPGVAVATTLSLIGLNLANVRAARKQVGVRTFVYFSRAEWWRVLRLLAGRFAPKARS